MIIKIFFLSCTWLKSLPHRLLNEVFTSKSVIIISLELGIFFQTIDLACKSDIVGEAQLVGAISMNWLIQSVSPFYSLLRVLRLTDPLNLLLGEVICVIWSFFFYKKRASEIVLAVKVNKILCIEITLLHTLAVSRSHLTTAVIL
jgi:hypothetical protein